MGTKTDINLIYDRVEQTFRGEELTESQIHLFLTRNGRYILTENQKDLGEIIMQKYVRKQNEKIISEQYEDEQNDIYIQTHSYRRNGHDIRGYKRHRPLRFDTQEKDFITQRRQQGLKPKDIIKEYRQEFKASQRSDKSITAKIYRT